MSSYPWLLGLRFGRGGHSFVSQNVSRRCVKDHVRDVGRTSRDDGGSGAMGHAMHSNFRKIRRSILRNTMDHSTKGRRIRNIRNNFRSTMDRSSKDPSICCSNCSTGYNTDCSNYRTGCSACSNTMKILGCMDRSNIRICFQDPISSRKGFPRQSR